MAQYYMVGYFLYSSTQSLQKKKRKSLNIQTFLCDESSVKCVLKFLLTSQYCAKVVRTLYVYILFYYTIPPGIPAMTQMCSQ